MRSLHLICLYCSALLALEISGYKQDLDFPIFGSHRKTDALALAITSGYAEDHVMTMGRHYRLVR